jgi:hypothetical protein
MAVFSEIRTKYINNKMLGQNVEDVGVNLGSA